MIKKTINTLLGLLFSFLTIFSLCDCSNKNKPENWDGTLDGAYFITDDSYRSYVQDIADKYDKNALWVTRIVNDNFTEEDYGYVESKRYFYCVIIQNKITTAFDMTYEFTASENGYIGHMFYNEVSFYNDGNILHVTEYGMTLDYKKNNEFKRNKDMDDIYETPNEVTYEVGDELLYFQWWGGFHSDYAVGEVKRPGSRDYEIIAIDHFYQNNFVIQPSISYFGVGENYFRIYHLGRPAITNTYDIVMHKDSKSIDYKVVKAQDNTINVEILTND